MKCFVRGFFSFLILCILYSCAEAGTGEKVFNTSVGEITVRMFREGNNTLVVQWNVDNTDAVSHYVVTVYSVYTYETIVHKETNVQANSWNVKSASKGTYKVELNVVANDGSTSTMIGNEHIVVTSEATPPGPVILHTIRGQDIIVDARGSTVDLRWDAPDYPGQLENGILARIMYYTILWRIKGSEQSEVHRKIISGEQQYVRIHNLQTDTSYVFTIQAYNNGGEGSTPSNAEARIGASRAQAPAIPEINLGSAIVMNQASIQVQWPQLEHEGQGHHGEKATLTGYTLYWKTGDTVSTQNFDGMEHIRADTNEAIISNLLFYQFYAVILLVENNAGISSVSEQKVIRTPLAELGEAPGKVQEITVQQDTAKPHITVRWKKPANQGLDIDGNKAELTEYVIYWAPGALVGKNANRRVVAINNKNARSYKAEFKQNDGLEYATQYTVSVCASSSIGIRNVEGPLGNPVTVWTADLSLPPEPVHNIQKVQSNITAGEITIKWEAGDTGSDAAGYKPEKIFYEIYYSSIDHMEHTSLVTYGERRRVEKDVGSVVTLFGLEPATEYNFFIRTVNENNPKLFADSEIQTLRSNGTLLLDLMSNGNLVSEYLPLRYGTDRFLSFHAETIPAGSEIIWKSSDPTVVSMDNGQIEVLDVGQSVISATLGEDRSQTRWITIDVLRLNIAEYYLVYPVEMESAAGVRVEYRISKNIPDYIPLSYKFISDAGTLPPEEITIDKNSGTITVEANLAAGVYPIQIFVTGPASTTTNWKILESNIIIHEDHLVYKPTTNLQARRYFTAGDALNPWLFALYGQDTSRNIRGQITISTSEKKYYEEWVDSLIDSNGVMGFGPRMDSFNEIADGSILEIRLNLQREGVDYIEKTITVEKAAFGHLYSWHDLHAIRNNLDMSYTLMTDIAFPDPGTYGFPVEGFKPVGGDTNAQVQVFQGTVFSGSLNGNSKSITNLYINTPDLNFIGLFGVMQRKEEKGRSLPLVRDLTLVNPRVVGQNSVGSIAGSLRAGMVSDINVIMDNSPDAEHSYIRSASGNIVGGIVGMMGEDSELLRVYNAVPVDGRRNIGGLVGQSGDSCTIDGISSAAVGREDTSFFVGGIVGSTGQNNIIRGSVSGNIQGVDNIGGIIGYLFDNSTVNASFSGTLSGTNLSGGLVGSAKPGQNIVGYVTGTIIQLPSAYGDLIGGLGGAIVSSHITGFFSGRMETKKGSYIGGLVGYSMNNQLIGYMSGSLVIQEESSCIGGFGGKIAGGRVVGYIWPQQRETRSVACSMESSPDLTVYIPKNDRIDILTDNAFPQYFDIEDETPILWPKLKLLYFPLEQPDIPVMQSNVQ